MNFNKFETLVFLIYLFNINQVIFTRDVTLPSYSIDYFDTLSHMFTTHFTGSHPHQTTTISLLDFR